MRGNLSNIHRRRNLTPKSRLAPVLSSSSQRPIPTVHISPASHNHPSLSPSISTPPHTSQNRPSISRPDLYRQLVTSLRTTTPSSVSTPHHTNTSISSHSISSLRRSRTKTSNSRIHRHTRAHSSSQLASSSLPTSSRRLASLRAWVDQCCAQLRVKTSLAQLSPSSSTRPSAFATQYESYLFRHAPEALPKQQLLTLETQRDKMSSPLRQKLRHATRSLVSMGRAGTVLFFGFILMQEFAAIIKNNFTLDDVDIIMDEHGQIYDRSNQTNALSTVLDVFFYILLVLDDLALIMRANPMIQDLREALYDRYDAHFSDPTSPHYREFYSSSPLPSQTSVLYGFIVDLVCDTGSSSMASHALFMGSTKHAPEDAIEAIPTERRYFLGRTFRFPRFKGFRLNRKGWSSNYRHGLWPVHLLRIAKELLFKVFLPVIDLVEWIAWSPQKYMAQRIADVFFFFDAKVAFHTRQWVRDNIMARYNTPLVKQIERMRVDNRSAFEISLFLLTYLGSVSKESYRIIENMPKMSNSDIDLAVSTLEKELRELQQTSPDQVELFAEHFRVYEDNLPVYFSETLRPFLVRLSEDPYDPLYKYFLFTYDKPNTAIAPLEKDELLSLQREHVPFAITRFLDRLKRDTLNLRFPFSEWTVHNQLLPKHFVDAFENAWTAQGFGHLTRGMLMIAIASKLPMFKRFFYNHFTVSYENRYKLYTYFTAPWAHMSVVTVLAATGIWSGIAEPYGLWWGKDNFTRSVVLLGASSFFASQVVSLSLARLLLAFRIHRPALLAPSNGLTPVITGLFGYTSMAFPDGDMRFYYFPVGTNVRDIVSLFAGLDVLGALFLLFNRRTGIPHIANLFGYAFGTALYFIHKQYGAPVGWQPENMFETWQAKFNIFKRPRSDRYKMERMIRNEDYDMKHRIFGRHKETYNQVELEHYIEMWNVLYRNALNRDFAVTEDNLNNLRALRQEWRANWGDEVTKAEVEQGVEDRSIPYLMHSARMAQRNFSRLQTLIEEAWKVQTGMILPRDLAEFEYERYGQRNMPIHPLESVVNPRTWQRWHRRNWGEHENKYFDENDQQQLAEWIEQGIARGVVNFTARDWDIWQLKPDKFPRVTQEEQRWFHPQDNFYEFDNNSLGFLHRVDWWWEGGVKRKEMWNPNGNAEFEGEGLFGERERFLSKFAESPRERSAIMNSNSLMHLQERQDLHYHARDVRRQVHKNITFPRWSKDENIGLRVRPLVHHRRQFFPEENEADFMDDYNIEQPLFQGGGMNEYWHNLHAVRLPHWRQPLTWARDAWNSEPTEWIGFQRKLYSQLRTPIRKTQKWKRLRSNNGMRYVENDKSKHHGRGWLGKRYRGHRPNRRRTNPRRSSHEDIFKGKVLQVQSYWPREKFFKKRRKWQNRRRRIRFNRNKTWNIIPEPHLG